MALNPTRRHTTDRWHGAAFNVKVEHHEAGTITVLELIAVGPDGIPDHVLEVPLDDVSRRTLAEALSHGLSIVRNGHPLPPAG